MAEVTIFSDFGAQKKSATVSSSISHEVMGLDAMILVFWMLSFKHNDCIKNLIKCLINRADQTEETNNKLKDRAFEIIYLG